MSSQSRYVRLGVFVISAVALLVAGIIVLGVGSMFKHYIRGETYFADSVQGLDVGAAVKYRGVTIGKVSSIGLLPESYRMDVKDDTSAMGRYIRVVMDIDPEPLGTIDIDVLRHNLTREVQSGFRVRLSSSLTGPAFLEFNYLDPNAYPPLPISWEPEHLYVPSAPASTSRIVSAVERIAIQLEDAKIGQVIQHIDDLILDANKSINDLQTAQLSDDASQVLRHVRASGERLEQILKGPAIDKVINDVSAISGSARTAVGDTDGNLQRTMDNLRATSTQLRETIDRINQLVNDRNLDDVIANLKTTSQNAAPAAEDLRLMLRRLDLVVTAQSRDLEAIIRNLRQITDNAAAVTQDARSNPSRLLFGEPPRRVKLGEQR